MVKQMRSICDGCGKQFYQSQLTPHPNQEDESVRYKELCHRCWVRGDE